MRKAIDAIIELIIVSLIVFAPTAFGSVHLWAYTAIELAVFAMLVLWAIKKTFLREEVPAQERGIAAVYAFLALFAAVALIQLLPLSPGAIKSLSPKTYLMFDRLIVGFGNAPRPLSVYPHATQTALIKFLSYAGIFFLITSEIRDGSRLRRIVVALAVAGFAEALYGLYGYFSKDYLILGFAKTTGFDSATGTYLNRNHFSGYLGIVVFMSIGYLLGRLSEGAPGRGLRAADFMRSPRAAEGGLLLVMVVTMILGIVFSLSRMGVLSFLAALFVVFFLTALGGRKKAAFALAAVVALAVIVAFSYGLEPLEERFDFLKHEDMKRGRLALWERSLLLAGDFPLTGTGLGTFEQAFQLYKGRQLAEGLSVITHAHNDYLQLFAEAGLPGGAILLSGGAFFLLLLLRKRSLRTDAFSRGLSAGGIGAMTYIALHSVTDFNMHMPANAMTFSIAAALAYSCAAGPQRPRSARGPLLRLLTKSAALLMAAIAIYAGTKSIGAWRAERAYPVERDFRRGYAPAGVPDEKQAASLMRSAGLSPDNYSRRIRLGKYYAYASPESRTAGRIAALDNAKREYLAANFLNPFYTESLVYLAWVEFSLKEPLRGVSALETAVTADPHNYFNHLYYGITVASFIDSLPESLRELNVYRAEEEFKLALALNPRMERHPSVIGPRAELHLKKGDLAGAVSELEKSPPPDKTTLHLHLRLAGLYMRSGRQNDGVEKYRVLLGTDGIERRRVIESLAQTASAHPMNAELRFLLGRAYFEDNRHEAALAELSAAAGMRPDMAEAHFLMGESYEALGDLRNAHEAYFRTLRRSKDHAGASRKILDLYRVR